MMLYKIVLVLAAFGALTGVINQMGFYSVKLPDSGIKGMTEAQVTDLSNSAANAPVNAFSSFAVLQTLVGILITTFTSVLAVSVLLVAYGCPIPLAIAIQGLVWIVMAVGIYQMYTGHQMPGMD